MRVFKLILISSLFIFVCIPLRAMTVSIAETFTCSSQEECKRKCKERGGRWKKDKTGTTHGTCTKPSAISGFLDLRTIEQGEVISALKSGELLQENESGTQILGYVRTIDEIVEISADCKSWTEVPLYDLVSMQETLIGRGNCLGVEMPFVKVKLRSDAGYAGGAAISYKLRKIGRQGISLPTFGGGGLFLSDKVIEQCTDMYLECQIDECAGRGQWCADMCDFEFDFCISDR